VAYLGLLEGGDFGNPMREYFIDVYIGLDNSIGTGKASKPASNKHFINTRNKITNHTHSLYAFVYIYIYIRDLRIVFFVRIESRIESAVSRKP